MATFTRFSTDDVVITTEKVFTNTFSSNILTTVDSSSTQNITATDRTASGLFYKDVYDADAASAGSEIQYAISYGNKVGSGSLPFTAADVGLSATRTIYSQYRSLVYGDETRNFTFNGHEPRGIYVLNIERARYKQALRLGSLNLKIGNALHLTDDSATSSGSAVLTNLGRQYNIVSGSSGVRLGDNLTQVTDSGSYGLFYPDAGVIILNEDTLDATTTDGGVLLNTAESSNANDENISKLYDAIGTGASFELDTQEDISSQFYFVRAKNKDFNYSTNASYIDANGNLNFTSMIDNPVSYITTVGLYNDANELLAVAKMSQPITKDFTKEALIKVKLDY
tara:strand:+ start:52 stop:1068 length:1017 start_codon:yes stop_codon:yes gene_type:complete